MVNSETKRILRTVFFDEATGEFCQCQGEFWKTCPMRAANNLPCKESIISITPVDRDSEDPLVSDSIRSIDRKLKNATDKLRRLPKKVPF